MISASQDDNATLVCLLEAQLMAALLKINTEPEVECFSAQSESECPKSGLGVAS